MNKMTMPAKVLIGVGIAATLLIIGLVVFGGGSNDRGNTSSGANYQKTDSSRPIAALSQSKIDWGNIKVSDTKESVVELKNNGKSNLEITRMSTSCGCTSVKAIFPDGKETKEYNMHKTSEKVTVAPGEAIKLKIIYRPFTMPVEGAVTRQVFLETNDPNNLSLEIAASAVVQK